MAEGKSSRIASKQTMALVAAIAVLAVLVISLFLALGGNRGGADQGAVSDSSLSDVASVHETSGQAGPSSRDGQDAGAHSASPEGAAAGGDGSAEGLASSSQEAVDADDAIQAQADYQEGERQRQERAERSYVEEVGNPVDAQGSLSVYALVEYTGAECADFMSAEGYVCDDRYAVWTKKATDSSLSVEDAEGPVGLDAFTSLGMGGQGLPVQFVLSGTGYANVQEGVESMTQVEIVDAFYRDENTAIVLLQSSSGDQYLVFANCSSGALELDILNSEAVATGLFAGRYGYVAGEGISPDMAWRSIVGPEMLAPDGG